MNRLNLLLKAVCVALVLSASVITPAVMAKEPATGAAAELRQLLQQADALRGKFEQRQYDSDGHLLQTTEGKFAVQRPGNFYWESLPPYEQLIVSNGDRLWVYDPDLEQVTVHNQQQQDRTSPAQLLSGELADLEDHYQVNMEAEGDNRRFTLVSTSDDAMVESLQLFYEKDTLAGLQFIDNLGQITELKFSDVQLNPSLDRGLFQFDVPTGVDVIIND